MKRISLALILLLNCTLIFTQSIPRKASLGVYLDNAPQNSGAIYSIKDIIPQSTAEDLALEQGDLLLAINGQKIESPNVLFGTLQSLRAGDDIQLSIQRGSETKVLSGKMKAKPLQAHRSDAEIILEEVPFREGKIRAIVNKPKGKGPFKTIYFIQGYPCQSIDWQNPKFPFVRLVHQWVDQGYAVVRVEKPGAGEYVNCADCMEMTFTDELEGFSNGYEKIQSLDYVDKDNIILYGHSLGGNVAPYLAAKYFPKGVITYGTVIRPWEEFLIAMMRYQQPVIGEDYVQNEEGLAFARKAVYQLFHEKKTLADLQFTNQEKHLLQDYLGVTEDGLVFNRTLAFWQALNDHNFTAYWSKVESKVLSLYGSADIEAVSPRDAQTIAEVVNHYHPNHATFKLIEGADHAIIQVGDQKTGWNLKQTGQYQQYLYGGVDKGFLQVVDEWLANLNGEPTLHPKTKVEQSFSDASTRLPAYMTHFGTMDVESADLDQDGDEDIVLAMEGQSNLILWNNGKGDFSNAQKLPSKHPLDHPKLTGEDSEDIAIADFDQDGDLDLLFATEDTKYHELLWNDGKGHFTPADYDFPKMLNANAVAVWDINGDNYPDVLMGNQGQNQLYINQKNGSFKEETQKYWPNNSDHTQDLKIVDIDKDGDLDIVEGAEQGGSNIYLREGNRFKEVTKVPKLDTHETRKVIIEDINQDGWQDILLCNVGWDPNRNARNVLLLNDRGQSFAIADEQTYPKDLSTTLDALFIDLNADGKKDLLTANGWGTKNLQTFIAKGNSLVLETDILPEIAGTAAISLLAKDFNKDGKLDLYIGHHNEIDGLLFSK